MSSRRAKNIRMRERHEASVKEEKERGLHFLKLEQQRRAEEHRRDEERKLSKKKETSKRLAEEHGAAPQKPSKKKRPVNPNAMRRKPKGTYKSKSAEMESNN
jgi:hypothetical protein